MWKNPCSQLDAPITDNEIPDDRDELRHQTFNFSEVSDIGIISRNYQFAEKLGEGSYATVYKLKSIDGVAEFAVKVYKIDEKDANRLYLNNCAEYNALKKLNHTNIIKIYDAFIIPNLTLAVIMPIYESSLQVARFADLDAFDLEWRIDLFEQIGNALLCLHRSGYVHRDVKPDNILVKRMADGNKMKFVITDLGMVLDCNRIVETDILINIFCSHAYIPLEALLGHRLYDDRVDVFSFGSVMYFALTGSRMINRNGWVEIAQHVCEYVNQMGLPTADDLTVMTDYPALSFFMQIVRSFPSDHIARRINCGMWETLLLPMTEMAFRKRSTMEAVMELFGNIKSKLPESI